MKKINNKGFTLIEVLAVIAIIAILGLVAVPGVLNSINNSKKASYNILIENIKEAGIRLFDEVDLAGNSVKVYYVTTLEPTDVVQVNEETNECEYNKCEYIDIPLQTLISNGFIKGTINKKEGTTSEEKIIDSNANTLILLNPVTEEDMGSCQIRIKKETASNGKVTYTFVVLGSNAEKEGTCPTTDEYKNGVK